MLLFYRKFIYARKSVNHFNQNTKRERSVEIAGKLFSRSLSHTIQRKNRYDIISALTSPNIQSVVSMKTNYYFIHDPVEKELSADRSKE